MLSEPVLSEAEGKHLPYKRGVKELSFDSAQNDILITSSQAFNLTRMGNSDCRLINREVFKVLPDLFNITEHGLFPLKQEFFQVNIVDFPGPFSYLCFELPG